MSFTTIIFAIVILHFLVGFGYLVYKLSGPTKKEKEEKANQE